MENEKRRRFQYQVSAFIWNHFQRLEFETATRVIFPLTPHFTRHSQVISRSSELDSRFTRNRTSRRVRAQTYPLPAPPRPPPAERTIGGLRTRSCAAPRRAELRRDSRAGNAPNRTGGVPHRLLRHDRRISVCALQTPPDIHPARLRINFPDSEERQMSTLQFSLNAPNATNAEVRSPEYTT